MRAKLLPVPAAPAPVAIEQRGDRFLVSWKIPKSNQNGSPLTDLQGFRVSRMRFIPGEECPDCRPDFTLVREVDLDYLRGVRRLDDRLYWWDDQPQLDYGYVYQVVAMAAGDRPGIPAEARRLFVSIPPPPQQLQATGLDRLVRLRWAPPAEIPGKFLGYYVYRHEADADLPLQPINSAAADGARFRRFRPGERPHLSLQRDAGDSGPRLPGGKRPERHRRGHAAGRQIEAAIRPPAF